MRMMAWITLAFTCFMIFVIIMETMLKDKWPDAVNVDATVTNFKRSRDKQLVQFTFTNPFTEQEVRKYFPQMGSRSKVRSAYPIESIHTVWVTEAGLMRQQAKRPNGNVFGVSIILAVLASLTFTLFWFSRALVHKSIE